MADETRARLKQVRKRWFDSESGRSLALNRTPALTVNEVKRQLSPLSEMKPGKNYFKQGKTRIFIGPRNDRTDVLDYLERIGVGKDKLDKYRYDSKTKGKLNLAGLSADEKTELSDLYGRQLTKRRNDLRDKLSKADPSNRFRDYKPRTRMEVIADLMPSDRTRAALGYADPNVRPGMSAADPNSIAASAAGVGAAAASHAGTRGTSASGGSGYSVFRGSGRVGAGGINFREFGMSSGGTSGWLGGSGGAGREAGKAMRTFFQNGPRGNAFYNGRWEYTGGEVPHDNPDGTPYFTKSTAGGYTSTSSAEKEWKRKAFEINRAQTIAYNNYLMSAQGKRERAMNQLADEFALMEEQAARTVRDELRASKEMAKRGIIPVFDNNDEGRNAADVSWFLRKPPEVARREEAEMATSVTPPEKKPKEGATT